jgi:NAD(P)-dependent dehydrogenase (short-subunit alcohol dehydrogenase family)
MQNKIVLITGSSDGIGKQTAVDLANMGAHVIVHGRTSAKTEKTIRNLNSQVSKGKIYGVSGDLSSFDSIHKISRDLHDRFDRIDVLINNAGVFQHERLLSQDGIELTFSVNHLSYYLLTGLLLDLIRRSEYARIVNVASQAHARQLDFENLQGEKYYEGYDAYSRSKLCNILFTYFLSEALTGSGVTANVLHPGVIGTKLLHEGFGAGGSQLTEGSKTSVFLASDPGLNQTSGRYYSNQQAVRSARISYERSVQQELWRVSEMLTGFIYNFDYE